MILSEKLKAKIEEFLNGFSLSKGLAVASSFGTQSIFECACNGTCTGMCADGCTSCAGSNK